MKTKTTTPSKKWLTALLLSGSLLGGAFLLLSRPGAPVSSGPSAPELAAPARGPAAFLPQAAPEPAETTQVAASDHAGHYHPPAAPEVERPKERPALTAAERAQRLERTTRLLGASLPWLKERREAAERAGQTDEARALALREARLTARLALVAKGTDPDAPLPEAVPATEAPQGVAN